jgi:hypothetical protein
VTVSESLASPLPAFTRLSSSISDQEDAQGWRPAPPITARIMGLLSSVLKSSHRCGAPLQWQSPDVSDPGDRPSLSLSHTFAINTLGNMHLASIWPCSFCFAVRELQAGLCSADRGVHAAQTPGSEVERHSNYIMQAPAAQGNTFMRSISPHWSSNSHQPAQPTLAQ